MPAHVGLHKVLLNGAEESSVTRGEERSFPAADPRTARTLHSTRTSTMTSMACMYSSVRAACQHTAACFPSHRGFAWSSSVGRRAGGLFAGSGVVAQQPCVAGARPLHGTAAHTALVQPVRAARVRAPATHARRDEDRPCQGGRRVSARTAVSPHSPHSSPRSHAADLVTVQSLFHGDVAPQLCARLAHLPASDRVEALATLLGACVEFGVEAHDPLVSTLLHECQELLLTPDVGVAQLCHLGEVACALQGRGSALAARVVTCLGVAVEEEELLSAGGTARIYSLLARCFQPANPQHTHTLSTLHTHTQRMVHRLTAQHVCSILQALLQLQHSQVIPVVLRLSRRASRVFKAFTDEEVIQVLSALMSLGQHDEELLAAMEKHLPERFGKCDPELISAVMEYCLQMRCRSEPIFEAVAENFVCSAETHTTVQIAKQVVSMGRLNYLPQCSSEMFKKLESILLSRFSHFQPRSLIELLHACIHLERFPLNHVSKVFSPYFLQRVQAQGEPLDKNALGQLTQLHLSTSLECTHYRGPGLPKCLQLKKFSSLGQAFEAPMDWLLYRQVKKPLTKLLGGDFYYTRSFTQCGYIIDMEICLDESGLVLPLAQWDHTHRRVALCLDDHNRFCSNTQHLLGKEATKRRHLRKMGFAVVQIPYFEFERLQNREEQVQYLYKKIFPTTFEFSS